MKTLLSHPTGNQNSRQAALALSEAGLLQEFVTAADFDSNSWLARCLPGRLRAELSRRDFSDVVPHERMQSVAAVRECVRLFATKVGVRSLLERERGWASVDQVYHAVDRAVAGRLASEEGIDTVYAYEDGALATFQAARERGIQRVYELPIGYWRTHRRLCAEEAKLLPEWSHTWEATADSDAKVARKDAELAIASRIIVPSRFVAESLSEFSGALPSVCIVPYGCPEPITPDARRWYCGGKLRVLFVGGLSQRKGLLYLLNALHPFADAVSLTVIGAGPGRSFIGNSARMLGSVPHSVVIQEMRQHDLLVFPTLFEGYSLAVSEALSQGLPVITTPNSGAADIIKQGEQGWVVPIRDSSAIAHCLAQCLERPGKVEEMGRAALALAGSYTWAEYRRRFRAAVLVDEEPVQ